MKLTRSVLSTAFVVAILANIAAALILERARANRNA